jgi:hypothetical protein
VLTCLHFGLIPVASYESGVDIEEFGSLLMTSSIEEIKESVRQIATSPAIDLERRARRGWEWVRKEHTRENFAERYRQIIRSILSQFSAPVTPQ